MISNDDHEFQSREDLLRACEAARLRLAFFDLQEEQMNQLEAENVGNAELDRFMKETEPADMAFIGREVHKEHVRRFGKRTLHVAGYAARIAATLIAVFAIGISTAYALIPEFQVKVAEMFVRMTDQYAEIGLQERGSINVPSEWEGDYFPTYIPEGFVLRQVGGEHTDAPFFEYSDQEGNRLSFFEHGIGGRTNIDVEGAVVTPVTVHDNSGFASEKDGWVVVAWPEFNQYFHVMLDGDLDTALKIARSVIKIK